MAEISSHTFECSRGPFHYLSTGLATGKLLIWVHGWPEGAMAWKAQLLHFGRLGYRSVAIDAPGYGKTFAPKGNHEDYSLKNISECLLELLAHLKKEKAVWLSHDWGSAVVWAFAGNYPQHCEAAVGICIPYGSMERGLEQMVKYVDRGLYPEDQYPYGPWGYWIRYKEHFDETTDLMDTHVQKLIKLFYRPTDKSLYGKPSFLSLINETGWFNGSAPPDIPFEGCLLDRETHDDLVAGFAKNGFFGPNSYYVNSEKNAEYNNPARLPNGGMLKFPVLFIDAKYDSNCYNEVTNDWQRVQRESCEDLTRVVVETGHWVAQEAPDLVNENITEWLLQKGFSA